MIFYFLVDYNWRPSWFLRSIVLVIEIDGKVDRSDKLNHLSIILIIVINLFRWGCAKNAFIIFNSWLQFVWLKINLYQVIWIYLSFKIFFLISSFLLLFFFFWSRKLFRKIFYIDRIFNFWKLFIS